MRRRWVTAALVACFGSIALADGNHPMAGCGLGYMLLGHDNNSTAGQVIGATTNGTFGNQTFGITSGTSGCTQDGAVKMVKATEVFAEVNFDSLQREMAIGRGEYVETFASLLGATDATRSEWLRFFQREYTALFPTFETRPEEMLHALRLAVPSHPELAG